MKSTRIEQLEAQVKQCQNVIDDLKKSLKKQYEINHNLYKALSILKDPQYQLEVTPAGYAIFRLNKQALLQISEALKQFEDI